MALLVRMRSQSERMLSAREANISTPKSNTVAKAASGPSGRTSPSTVSRRSLAGARREMERVGARKAAWSPGEKSA